MFWKQACEMTGNDIQTKVKLGHAHFQGKLFVRLLGIPLVKLYTKFEV